MSAVPQKSAPAAIPMREASGRMLDLANLTPADIDFHAMAAALARINRFNGKTAVPVNVAQHSLIVADCARARGHAWAVPWVLLHDGHEYILGDITTPAQNFLAWIAGGSGYGIADAIWMAKYHVDKAVYAAAGLLVPEAMLRTQIRAIIKRADEDAYLIELRDFHRCVRPDDFEYAAMAQAGKIMPRVQKPLSCADSEILFLAALREHLPCFGAAAPHIPQLPQR